MATTSHNSQYFRQVFAALGAVVAVASYPLAVFGNEEIVVAVAGGIILSIIHALMGYAVIEFSLRQQYDMFTQIVIGGIALRLLVLTGLFLVSVLVLKVHVVALTISLFVMYVVFLTIEVLHIYARRQVKTRLQNS